MTVPAIDLFGSGCVGEKLGLDVVRSWQAVGIDTLFFISWGSLSRQANFLIAAYVQSTPKRMESCRHALVDEVRNGGKRWCVAPIEQISP